MSSPFSELTRPQIGLLLVSILVVALCGIVYQLIIGAVSTYLLGNSVVQFSLTIGFFMFAMGVGSYLSRFIRGKLLDNFIRVEIAIALVGGICSLVLFMVFPMLRALYEPVMYSLIFVIGTLVGLEIPILMTVLSDRIRAQDAIANVMALDYVGALIGSVSFPLLLLPVLGLVRSSFAIGLITVLTALVNIYYFRDRLVHPKRLAALALVVLATLITMTLYGTWLTRYAEHHLYFDQVLFDKQTPYQKITFTQSVINNDYRLYLDGHIQFSTRDEYRYHEALVHPVMSASPAHQKVLVLGGGDGMAVREILKYPEISTVDLVDIDPAMTELGRDLQVLRHANADSLHDPRVTVHNADAFSFINQPGALYDVVIIDMPDPHNEMISKLYSREFYTMIQKRMQPEAVLVTQSSSPFFARRTFWMIHQTLAEVFPAVKAYHIAIPSFGIWGYNLASSTPLPKHFPIRPNTRFLTTDTMNVAQVFGRDIAKLDSEANSIMEPKIYKAYLQDLGG
jgi:spermidine synthase